MPKRATEETQKLMQQAFQLLDSGYSKQDVAKAMSTSVRSVERWVKKRDYEKPVPRADTALIEVGLQKVQPVQIYKAVIASEGEAEPYERLIADLEHYHETQRSVALGLSEIVLGLLPLIKNSLNSVQQEEISVRVVPALVKSVGQMADDISNCWLRSTGLQEILDDYKQQQNPNSDW